jgi:non-specific serine/threonine protein kinase
MEKLQFLLTKDGFRVDDMLYAEKETQALAGDFAKAPYEALYELAFRERPECFDAAGVFLFQVAESFVEALVNTSGLELSREKTELVPREETIELLLDSVPFVLGAEFVTRTWVKRQYRKLLAVFAKQIKSYSGKVSLYFAEKNQKLHVPERVFFHLVEEAL